MLRSEAPSFEKCIRWSAKFSGTNMPLPRNEDLDVGYTTMLNHTHKLILAVLPIPVLAVGADGTIFLCQFLRFQRLKI